MKLLLVHDSHPEINAVGKVRNVEQMTADVIGASVRELLITREGILAMRDQFKALGIGEILKGDKT